MSTDARLQKVNAFRSLHQKGAAVIVPNAWDAGSARLLTGLGFDALATTSAGYAFSKGRRDSFSSLTRGEILANASEIVSATHVPVSADLEDGFGPRPEACAETVRAACEIGLVGGTIEDATGDPDNPIFEMGYAVERISAAAEAAKEHGFVLTARAENFVWGRPDLTDTLDRLIAFEKAGADVLYAPGLPDLDAIRLVCRSLENPVNVVMGLAGRPISQRELADAGVARISVGGSFARAGWGAVLRAAQEVRDLGTFTYADDAIPDGDMAQRMSQTTNKDRG